MISVSGLMLINGNVMQAEASEVQKMGMYLNNDEVTDGNMPFIKDGRTYVPIRTVGDLLGVKTQYNNDTKTVTISNDKIIADFVVDSKIYKVNGKEFTSESTPIIKDGRVYISLRVVAEVFGADVYIDKVTKSVVIEFKDEISSLNSNNTDFTGLSAVLSDYYNIPSEKIATLTEIEIKNYMDIYYELQKQGVSAEVLDKVKSESFKLYVDIMKSEDFLEFEKAIIKSDEARGVLSDILKTESFARAYLELVDSDEYKILTKEIATSKAYAEFMADFKQLEQYSPLVEKYGDDLFVFGNSYVNLKDEKEIRQKIDSLSEQLKDEECLKFFLEVLELDSFGYVKSEFDNLKQTTGYSKIYEGVYGSEKFNSFVAENVNNFERLFECIKKIPEANKVTNMYKNGISEILEKNKIM